MRLFICKHPNHETYAIVSVPYHAADEREHAKRVSSRFIGGDPDQYVVQPLTNHGANVRLNISLEP